MLNDRKRVFGALFHTIKENLNREKGKSHEKDAA